MLATGRDILAKLHTRTFGRCFDIDVIGLERVPKNQQLLIAANHCSHLDYGTLKFALEDHVVGLSALAAADYFFDERWKRRLLLPLTDLIPVMRQGSFSLALKGAEEAIARGRSIIIFPEGTRGVGESLLPFRPGVGYLQRRSELPVLPVYLWGTHQILPKGQTVPRGRRILVLIGEVMDHAVLSEMTRGKRTSKSYQAIAESVRYEIQKLADSRFSEKR